MAFFLPVCLSCTVPAALPTNIIPLSSSWHTGVGKNFFLYFELELGNGKSSCSGFVAARCHSSGRSRGAPARGILAIVRARPALAREGLRLMETKSEFLLCASIHGSLTMKIEPALILLGLTKRYLPDCKSAFAHTIVWQNLFLKVHKFYW